MPYRPTPPDRHARKARVDALLRLLAEYDAGTPLSCDGLALTMEALRAVMRHGRDFVEALGLGVGRGQRTSTLQALVTEIEAESRTWVRHVQPVQAPVRDSGATVVLHGRDDGRTAKS